MKRFASGLLAIIMLLYSCALAEVVEIIGPVESAAVENIQAEVTPEASEPLVQDAQSLAELAGAVSNKSGSVTPEPTAVPRLHGLKIGIDPGHQSKANSDKEPVAPGSKEKKAKVSSGTSGRSTGIAEYITVLEISMKLKEALEAQGAEVYMTRETHDIDISNLERAEMMNELGVDLVLRIHCDGAEDKSANGIGLFVRKTGEKQEESEAAAHIILDAMVEATGAHKRGVFLRDTYTMNNWSVVPCILVECGFMSNLEEDEKLNSPEYQSLLAQGMVEGIAAYFER